MFEALFYRHKKEDYSGVYQYITIYLVLIFIGITAYISIDLNLS